MTDRLDLPFTGIATFFRSRVCSDLSKLDADVAILGIPNDEGSWWLPGERFAPRKLREMSLRFVGGTTGGVAGFWDIDEDRRFLDYELGSDRIVDCGDVDVITTKPDDTWDNVTHDVGAILAAGALPVILGGDHSNSFPVVRAYRDSLTVVHFDAHMDYYPFIHGVRHSWGNPMRLITALDHVDRVIQVGIRSFRTAQQDVRDSLEAGNKVITASRLQSAGPTAVLDLLAPDTRVYVSIDMDVLDLPMVPGVSAPEPDGLSYGELKTILVEIARKTHVVGFDVVEVNPLLDTPTSQTAFLAVQVLTEFLGRVVEHPKHRGSHPRPATA